MNKVRCSTCKKLIVNRDDAIVIWFSYDSNNNPKDPRIVHKKFVAERDKTFNCDNKTWNYSYEVTAFIKDFPSIKISTAIQ